MKYKRSIPYKVSDILIFKSSTGTQDTVVVTKIFEQKTDRQHLPHLIGRNFLDVDGVSLSDYGNHRHRLATTPMVSIHPGKETASDKIFLGMCLNENYRLANFIENLDSLFNLPKIKITTQTNVIYDDVIILNTGRQYPMVGVSKIYWSLSNGYIRLFNNKNDSTELVRKYSDSELYINYKNTPYY